MEKKLTIILRSVGKNGLNAGGGCDRPQTVGRRPVGVGSRPVGVGSSPPEGGGGKPSGGGAKPGGGKWVGGTWNQKYPN